MWELTGLFRHRWRPSVMLFHTYADVKDGNNQIGRHTCTKTSDIGEKWRRVNPISYNQIANASHVAVDSIAGIN